MIVLAFHIIAIIFFLSFIVLKLRCVESSTIRQIYYNQDDPTTFNDRIQIQPYYDIQSYYDSETNTMRSVIQIRFTNEPLHYDYDPEDNYQGENDHSKICWQKEGF